MKRAVVVLDALESNNNIDKLNLDNISFQDQAFKVFLALCIAYTDLSPSLLCPHISYETRRMLLTSFWHSMSVKGTFVSCFKTCSLLNP